MIGNNSNQSSMKSLKRRNFITKTAHAITGDFDPEPYVQPFMLDNEAAKYESMPWECRESRFDSINVIIIKNLS